MRPGTDRGARRARKRTQAPAGALLLALLWSAAGAYAQAPEARTPGVALAGASGAARSIPFGAGPQANGLSNDAVFAFSEDRHGRLWVGTGGFGAHYASFASLEPGRYTLHVQGSNNDGVWNAQGAQIRIQVPPPAWQTWWAYLLYALAAAAAVASFVHYQQRRVEQARLVARRERALAEDKAALVEELEAKNAELERFNYTVSHDLKSPLVTIKGFLGMLQKDAAAGDAERLAHDVRRIGAAADRMSRLLEELLELSRLGRQAQRPEEVALYQVAREALEQIRGQAGERAFEVLVDPGLPVVVGDRLRLQQLYQNLLSNALKYMGEQSLPQIEVGWRRDVEAAGGAPAPVFFVSDNGIGIDMRYQEKVFGLFERLDAAEEGTGVGLALVKRIVEMHGGRIWVESEGLGSGSSFCFTLPQDRMREGT